MMNTDCAVQVVVCTNTMMKESILLDELCHKHNIGFIKADTFGVFASVFCDFGKGFQVLDVDGKSVLLEAHTSPSENPAY